MKPICLTCRRFFTIKKNGVEFIEAMPKGDTRPLAGMAEPESWKPYKIWMGDLWECQGCGAQVISGTGLEPVAHRHSDNFWAELVGLGDEPIQINDC